MDASNLELAAFGLVVIAYNANGLTSGSLLPKIHGLYKSRRHGTMKALAGTFASTFKKVCMAAKELSWKPLASYAVIFVATIGVLTFKCAGEVLLKSGG